MEKFTVDTGDLIPCLSFKCFP